MTYLTAPDHPRIVLLDCNDEVVSSIRAAEYDLEVGYTGYFQEHPAMEVPKNLHEKDLLVVDLDPGWKPKSSGELFPPRNDDFGGAAGKHAREPFLRGEPLRAFNDALKRGAVLILLLEGKTLPVDGKKGRGSLFSWLPVDEVPFGRTGKRTGLHTIDIARDEFLKLAPDMEGPNDLTELLTSQVQQVTSLRTLTKCEPLLVNESGGIKAGFLTLEAGGLVLLLPYFHRKPAALHRLLNSILPASNSELFPVRTKDWPEKDAYQMPVVRRLRDERRRLQAEHEKRLVVLEGEEADAVEQQQPFTSLLKAHGEDLPPVVQSALDFLGFEVTDHDAEQRAKNGRYEEDLQVKDGDYFAVVEVTSSRGNAKDKDFTDLLKYRGWRAKDPGRDDVDATNISGMLIVNQMHQVEPAKRQPLYASSSDVDWAQEAVDHDVTLVSSWEFFKLVRAVEAEELTKDAARAALQQPGLFIAPV